MSIEVKPVGRGVANALLDGAVAYARSRRAPAIEGYPADNKDDEVNDDEVMAALQRFDRLMGRVGFRGKS